MKSYPPHWKTSEKQTATRLFHLTQTFNFKPDQDLSQVTFPWLEATFKTLGSAQMISPTMTQSQLKTLQMNIFDHNAGADDDVFAVDPESILIPPPPPGSPLPEGQPDQGLPPRGPPPQGAAAGPPPQGAAAGPQGLPPRGQPPQGLFQGGRQPRPRGPPTPLGRGRHGQLAPINQPRPQGEGNFHYQPPIKPAVPRQISSATYEQFRKGLPSSASARSGYLDAAAAQNASIHHHGGGQSSSSAVSSSSSSSTTAPRGGGAQQVIRDAHEYLAQHPPEHLQTRMDAQKHSATGKVLKRDWFREDKIWLVDPAFLWRKETSNSIGEAVFQLISSTNAEVQKYGYITQLSTGEWEVCLESDKDEELGAYRARLVAYCGEKSLRLVGNRVDEQPSLSVRLYGNLHLQ
eukprot:gene29902-37033_t